MVIRLLSVTCVAAVCGISAFAQYSLEGAGAPPSIVPPAYASLLQKDGSRVIGPSGPWAEVWFRSPLPAGPKSGEEAVSYPTIPIGAVVGVVRFVGQGADRRGQTIKAGVYTLRFANYPMNGDHQGVAPQRDFALLTPIADDPDPAAAPSFEQLVDMSRKASGTPHPAVLSIEIPPADAKLPSVAKEGEKDWTLSVKIGETPIAIIVVGKSES
jgi:hypothetical protein